MLKDDKIVDCEKLTDKELLEEFANRVIVYDGLKDDELNFLGEHPDQAFWTDEQDEEYEDLKIEIDNAWVRVRECIRVIKKDKEFWAC